MRKRERINLERFVRARTNELTDPRLRSSHRSLIALADRLRLEAERDADVNWVEALAVDLLLDDGGSEVAEEAFGDDPEAQAAALTTTLLMCLALAHDDHPEYDSR